MQFAMMAALVQGLVLASVFLLVSSGTTVSSANNGDGKCFLTDLVFRLT